MDRFLDAAYELRERRDGEVSGVDFDFVADLVQKRLQILHARSKADLDNIESVFSLIEMGRLLRRIPGTSVDEIEAAATSVRRLLSETVEHTCLFNITPKQIRPHKHYQRLAEAASGRSAAFITFNYDIALDYAIHFLPMTIDYGLQESSPQSIPVLKLHGSVNWVACSECHELRAMHFKDYFASKRSYFGRSARLPIVFAPSLSQLGSHCKGDSTFNVPALVPPSWNKTQYHVSFSRIWERAAQEISEARRIYVIGYSLPASDEFFRDLMRLALVSTVRMDSFTVVNPEVAVEQKFKNLIGPGLENRFKFIQKRVEEFTKEDLVV